MARAAVFFDVDGTLVHGTSSSAHLAQRLGHAESLRVLDQQYLDGRIHNSALAERDAQGYAGRTADDLLPWLEDLPMVAGIDEVVAWCHAQDLLPVLTTLAWRQVGQYLCSRYGFADACGPSLEQARGRYTGRVAEHLSPEGRRDYAAGICAEQGLRLEDAVAVGHSVSDLPLFAVVGCAIAFNASQKASEAADHALEGEDLRVVLPVLDAWFNTGPQLRSTRAW
jgi:phosphoserine phosphatase